MDIEYKGANCVIITTKKASILIDPRLSSLGLRDIVVKDAIQLATTDDYSVDTPQKILISGPGEYEAADISIRGIAATRHIDSDGAKKATMYSIETGNIRIGVVGHVRNLNEEQLELLGTLDVLIVPVGGGGYTLDSVEAIALVKQIAPKVVIPTHYADASIQYEVEQAPLETFVKDLAAPVETVAKYKIKNGVLPEVLTVVEITRTS